MLERLVFDRIADFVDSTLGGWKRTEEGTVDAYGLRTLSISSDRLRAIAGALRNVRIAFEVVQVEVVTFWYGEEWGESAVPQPDLITGSFVINMPLILRWSASNDSVLEVDIVQPACC